MSGVIIICFIIIICFCILIKYKNSCDKGIYKGYNISGYNNDINARNLVYEIKKLKNLSPIENFIMGEVLLNNIHNINESKKEYINTLNLIINKPLDNHNLFILDRIETDYNNIPEFNNNHILNYIPEIRNYVTNNKIKHLSNKTNKTNKTNKKSIKKQKIEALVDKQDWTQDMQSVHDSSIVKTMNDNYNNIKNYNSKEYGPLNIIDINNSIKNLQKTFETYNDNDNYRKVLKSANMGFNVCNMGTELEILTEIWRRINSNDNKLNKNNMKRSLYDSMNDCIENGSMVCTQGRVSRMMQSMVHLDNDSNMGLMKSIEFIRNEIYKDAAKILNDNIKLLSLDDQKNYNLGNHNNNINNMENNSRQQITEMINNIENLNNNQKSNLIKECISVI